MYKRRDWIFTHNPDTGAVSSDSGAKLLVYSEEPKEHKGPARHVVRLPTDGYVSQHPCSYLQVALQAQLYLNSVLRVGSESDGADDSEVAESGASLVNE